jgi:hypothetical protein
MIRKLKLENRNLELWNSGTMELRNSGTHPCFLYSGR